MRQKKYLNHHNFRCDDETDKIIDKLFNELKLNKSELIRESIKNYYKNMNK